MHELISDKCRSWASILDWQTRDQARVTASMPFVQPYLALMPDAHLGKGATVGSVIPTVGAIMPAAVGVDIGCGMIAVKTDFDYGDIMNNLRPLTDLHAAIAAAVPLSAGGYNQDVKRSTARRRIDILENMEGIDRAEELSSNWTRQLGTLGSGNHFIEVSLDEDNNVWLFLHSGSRGVGNKLATYHINVAKTQCADKKLPNKDLAYLTEGTPEFTDYMIDLQWAQRFALLNREEMMDRVIDCFCEYMGVDSLGISTEVNCHHNYTELYGNVGGLLGVGGERIYLSRKGAIDASEGVWGLIPGSMGDKSYVVVGKGNHESFCSAPHGAGRTYSRSAAKSEFTYEDLAARMEGVAWGESTAFIDEHPLAYKDIDTVMLDADDLVEIRYTLRQIVNVKGN